MTREEAIEAIKKIQIIIGAVPDGDWRDQSESSLQIVVGLSRLSVKASSFADPADIAAFKKCKAQGHSDVYCFKYGDNGIGQWGDNTAQTHTPMCALHANDMKKHWGSIQAAKHKMVRVVLASGAKCTCMVADRMSALNRIDLNPAASKVLGLNPPFLVDANWHPV